MKEDKENHSFRCGLLRLFGMKLMQGMVYAFAFAMVQIMRERWCDWVLPAGGRLSVNRIVIDAIPPVSYTLRIRVRRISHGKKSA
jgi:hypothetical protein